MLSWAKCLTGQVRDPEIVEIGAQSQNGSNQRSWMNDSVHVAVISGEAIYSSIAICIQFGGRLHVFSISAI